MIRQALLHADRRLRSLAFEGSGVFGLIVGVMAFSISSFVFYLGGPDELMPRLFFLILFLWFAPVLIYPCIRGRASGLSTKGIYSAAYQSRNLPSLPVSDRARFLGEALIATVWVIVFQLIVVLGHYVLLGDSRKSFELLVRCLGNSAFALPSFLILAAPLVPGRSFVLKMVASFLYGYAAIFFDILRSPALMAIVGATSGVAVLLGLGLELELPRFASRPRSKRTETPIFKETENAPFLVYLKEIREYVLTRTLPRGAAVLLLPVLLVQLVSVERSISVLLPLSVLLPFFLLLWVTFDGFRPLGMDIMSDRYKAATGGRHLFIRLFGLLPLGEKQVLAGAFLHGVLTCATALAVLTVLYVLSEIGTLYGLMNPDTGSAILISTATTMPILVVLVPASAVSMMLGQKMRSYMFISIALALVPFIGILDAVFADRLFALLALFAFVLAVALLLFLLTGTHRHARTLVLEHRSMIGGRR